METLVEKNNLEQDLGNPFDDESLKIIQTLPARPAFLQIILKFLRGFGTVLYVVGGIGIVAIAYNHLTKSNDSFSYLLYLIPLAPLIVGYIIKYIANYYLIDNAPLGNLAANLLQYLFQGNLDECSKVAYTIIYTKKKDMTSIGYYFIIALSYELLAEINEIKSFPVKAKEYAINAIEPCLKLKEKGIKTPFYYYTLANSYRIAEMYQNAIDAYEVYLKFRPTDNKTKEILVELRNKKSKIDNLDLQSKASPQKDTIDEALDPLKYKVFYTRCYLMDFWTEEFKDFSKKFHSSFVSEVYWKLIFDINDFSRFKDIFKKQTKKNLKSALIKIPIFLIIIFILLFPLHFISFIDGRVTINSMQTIGQFWGKGGAFILWSVPALVFIVLVFINFIQIIKTIFKLMYLNSLSNNSNKMNRFFSKLAYHISQLILISLKSENLKYEKKCFFKNKIKGENLNKIVNLYKLPPISRIEYTQKSINSTIKKDEYELHFDVYNDFEKAYSVNKKESIIVYNSKENHIIASDIIVL